MCVMLPLEICSNVGHSSCLGVVKEKDSSTEEQVVKHEETGKAQEEGLNEVMRKNGPC